MAGTRFVSRAELVTLINDPSNAYAAVEVRIGQTTVRCLCRSSGEAAVLMGLLNRLPQSIEVIPSRHSSVPQSVADGKHQSYEKHPPR
jgi:hypothetical protein